MKSLCALLFLVAGACGDNAPECGPGTSNVGGFCTPNGSTICGDGTKFDPDTGACLPDPTLCSGGTVLINGTCQDPTAGLTVDLEEGPEPNGFEPNASSAGTIDLKPIGDPNGFVVHGCIKPTADLADLDDYRIAVSAPTLIDVTADGVRGLAAGFATFGDDPVLATWRRFGINLQTDTSHRQIYLPQAGTYEFVMSDTRSLMGLFDGSNDVLEPAGNPDGSSCYYVTLNQLAIPALTTLAVPVGINDVIDDKVVFYAAALPTGVIDLQETIYSPHAAPAFVVDVSGQLHLDHDGELAFAGVKATDTTLVAVDFVYNYAFTPPVYSVSFAAATTAQALPRDGTTVTAASKTQVGTSFNTTNQFYFDADTTPLGMTLASTKPVQGVIWDSDLNVAGDFGGLAAQQSFTSFTGLWRAPKAGRYYFALIDPVDGAGTSFTITSTVATVLPQNVTVDTPLTAEVPNAFRSNLYTLPITGDTWDLFDVTATNIPGTVQMTMLDPATAYGRLDPLDVTTSSGPSTLGAEPPQISFFNFGAPRGFIVGTLSQPSVFLKVNTNPPTGTPTFDLDVSTRVFSDLAATSQTLASETAPLGDAHRYYMPVAPGTQVQLTVTPTVNTEDPILETLAPNEVVLANSDNPAGVAESLTSTIGLEGYIAFQVRGPAAQTYNLDIVVTPPFYSTHATTTAYANACASGTELQLHDNISDPQVTPTAFTFYGATINQYLITSSYITFDLADNGLAARTALPDGVGIGNIAPLWEPLADITVCTTISGTKTTLQWTGTELGQPTPVQFQAILDSADSSIEFVYGPNNRSNGQRFAAIGGVQDPTGTKATPTGNGGFAPFAAPGTSLKLTHP